MFVERQARIGDLGKKNYNVKQNRKPFFKNKNGKKRGTWQTGAYMPMLSQTFPEFFS